MGHSLARLKGTSRSVLLNGSCHKNHEYIWFRGGDLNSLRDIKVVRDPCQKITLLLLKSKSVRVIVPESSF